MLVLIVQPQAAPGCTYGSAAHAKRDAVLAGTKNGFSLLRCSFIFAFPNSGKLSPVSGILPKARAKRWVLFFFVIPRFSGRGESGIVFSERFGYGKV